jgi:hypothetical protein
MILGECVEKFLARSPVSVMVRGILERVFAPEKVERVFTDNALLQYTGEVTWAHCVELMSEGVFRIVPRGGLGQSAARRGPGDAASGVRQTEASRTADGGRRGGVGGARMGRRLAADAVPPRHRYCRALACGCWTGTLWAGRRIA